MSAWEKLATIGQLAACGALGGIIGGSGAAGCAIPGAIGGAIGGAIAGAMLTMAGGISEGSRGSSAVMQWIGSCSRFCFPVCSTCGYNSCRCHRRRSSRESYTSEDGRVVVEGGIDGIGMDGHR